MSYNAIEQSFSTLNAKIDELYRAGEPLQFEVNGKPRLHIFSFKPLVFERYGIFFNRAPNVAGDLTLRGFLTLRHDYLDGAIIYAGLQADEQSYGFLMSSENPIAISAINGVARYLGYPHPQIR